MTTAELDAFFAKGWNGHDVEALMTFMSEDCVFTFRGGKIAMKSSYFKNRVSSSA